MYYNTIIMQRVFSLANGAVDMHEGMLYSYTECTCF